MSFFTWWENLEPQWKQAFGSVCFGHFNAPDLPEIETLFNTTVLRFAGLRAPYPNMNVELSNLSGIEGLNNLEILVVTHHNIKSITSLQSLKKLKSLFLFNNQIESLSGIEALTGLEQLYVQFNKISSLGPLSQLTNLKELYVNNNEITSLDGLTESHSDKLSHFFCKPNDSLKQREMIYAENQLGIKCRGL